MAAHQWARWLNGLGIQVRLLPALQRRPKAGANSAVVQALRVFLGRLLGFLLYEAYVVLDESIPPINEYWSKITYEHSDFPD